MRITVNASPNTNTVIHPCVNEYITIIFPTTVFPAEDAKVRQILLIEVNLPRCESGILLEIYGLFPIVCNTSPSVNNIIEKI